MKALPGKSSEKGRSFTISDFYEAGREKLSLEVVAGLKNLGRTVGEPIVNRPGLALTGFYNHFAAGRLQLIGKGEMAYLKALPKETRLDRFRALLDRKAYFFVYTNGQRPSEEERDLADACGAVILTSPLKTRIFANQGTFILERLAAPTTSIYGTMIEVCGIGVMIEGDPGLGKSETALGLVKRGYALIADDLTCIRKEVANNLLFGSASDSTAGFMEIRGIGIMHLPSLFGVSAVRGEKRLQLIITFKRLSDVQSEIDRVGQTRQMKEILGVQIPNIIIPVSEGRDLVNLVETAVQQYKLLMTGYDPVETLSEHLRLRAEAAKRKTSIGNGG